MRDVIVGFLIGSAVSGAAFNYMPLAISWVGHPAIGDRNKETLSHITFGLRSDGVVVWRHDDEDRAK